MRKILFISLMFTACSITEPVQPAKDYTFDAFVTDGILHINYHHKTMKGFTIWISSDKDHVDTMTRQIVSHSYGCDQTTNWYWHPTYVTMENGIDGEQIKID